MSFYFAGCTGIKNPKDWSGVEIKEGDKLSFDYHDMESVGDNLKKALFLVEKHPSGDGLCAKGIHRDSYLHDFRFEYCDIVNDKGEG